jgi:hypothetical protein
MIRCRDQSLLPFLETVAVMYPINMSLRCKTGRTGGISLRSEHLRIGSKILRIEMASKSAGQSIE